jgi:NAD dependent epimerase/dehydratase family enzyme
VSADKLLQTGFVFKYPQIELALKEIYGDVAE